MSDIDKPAYRLAMLVLQSDFYRSSPDVRDATDDVLSYAYSSDVGELQRYQIRAGAAALWFYDADDADELNMDEYDALEALDRAIYEEQAEWCLHTAAKAKPPKETT